MKTLPLTSVFRLWAALVVAAVLLHAPAAASATPIAVPVVAHSDHVAAADTGQTADPTCLRDLCCAACTSTIAKFALLPGAVRVEPPASRFSGAVARLIYSLPTRFSAWSNARGPPSA